MDDSIEQFSIQHPTDILKFPYLCNNKSYVGGCILNYFMLSCLPCSPTFCCSAIPTSCYIFIYLFTSLF